MYAQQINQGFEILTAALGEGWQSLVNRNTLDQQTYSDCILGQLFGEFHQGLDYLGLTYEEAMEYGFCGACGDYDRLTEEWVMSLVAV